MGLDVSHDCWHGPYSAFMRFRSQIAMRFGIPDLSRIEGFGGVTPWPESIKENPIFVLLDHSDCDGVIEHKDCLPLAERLDAIAPLLESPYREQAIRFADGLRCAHEKDEDVNFS